MKKKNIIIIPAYNESGNIVNTVMDIKKSAPDFDYIVVNDCSTDNTLEILKENKFKYINLPINLGIGGAVQKPSQNDQKTVGYRPFAAASGRRRTVRAGVRQL